MTKVLASRKLRAAGGGLALVLAFLGTPAFAGDVEVCASDEHEAAIEACTRLLAKKAPRSDLATYRHHRGTSYYAKGEYDAAIADFNKAIEINDKYTNAYLNRGLSYDSKGDWDAAIADYTRVIELDDKNAQAYGYRGNAYNNKLDYDRAIQELDKSIELNPEEATTYLNRGYSYNMKGDQDHAFADYTKAIELNPQYILALNNRGSLYNDRGEYDKALADFDKSLSIDPNDIDALDGRGLSLNYLEQFDKSIESLNKAIEIDPKQSITYFNRGYALERKGDLDRALVDYKKCAELDPKNADAYNNIGSVHNQKGEYDLAIEALDKAIELKPDYALAYSNRASSYDSKGERERALADVNKVIEFAPKDPNSYIYRALILDNQGEQERAVLDYTTAIALDDKNSSAYNGRAWMFVKLGKFAQAKVDGKKAVELDPNGPAQMDTLGHALLGAGDVDEAIAMFTRAIGLGTKDATAFSGRGQSYEKRALRDLALADYRKALEVTASDDDQKTAQDTARTRLLALELAGGSPASTQTPVTPPPVTTPTLPATSSRPQSTAAVATAPPTSGRRVALVIGVGEYSNWSKLNNPVHDAQAVAKVLRDNGFTVLSRTSPEEVTFLGLYDAIADLEREAQGADIALVYYAGHGMQVGDKNILAPADMPDLCEEPHTKRAIELDSIFRAVKPARAKVVLLDACRNNPFPRCPKKADQSGSGFRALGRVEGTGLLIANATSPGALADDGISGQGSPFARALIARIEENPRQDLRDLLATVAADVETSTRSAQTPEVTLRGNVGRMCIAGAGCGQ